MKIFISYGRADALELATHLTADLTEHGHNVWLDLNNIETGGLFDVRIEQGIREASVVLAVMTPASVRADSVCRDEVVFALNQGKPIVPLRADQGIQVSLLLARRNWIDFTGAYLDALGILLRFLEGNGSVLHSPGLARITGVAPLDFGPEIARYSTNFVGRAWLFAELDRWQAEGTRRVLVIVGEPGIGKSAIAARLAVSHPYVVATHFCTDRDTSSLEPHDFAASIAAQLHARLPGFADAVATREPDRRRATGGDAFRDLVVQPAGSLSAVPGQVRIVVVDSLDEAATRSGETIVDVLVKHAPDLPKWLRFVVTTRPEARIIERLRMLDILELDADRQENRADLHEYLITALRDASPRDRVDEDVPLLARVEELAAGNFLYGHLTLEALREGSLSVDDVYRLAPGVAHFYAVLFRRRFADVEAFSAIYRPILRALAAAQAPLPFEVLTAVLGVDAEAMHQRLLDLRMLLRVSGQGESIRYRLFHRSLVDWLTSQEDAGYYWCDAAQGHATIGEALRFRWRHDDYALQYLVRHLLAAGEPAKAAELLLDKDFLERKTTAGFVFDLVGDFRSTLSVPGPQVQWRLLALIEEAIRTDVHFIARHPTALFQCLWNRGWWHDAPGTALHYQTESPESQQHEAASDGFSAWLRVWRSAKEQATPGFTWLRSLRPPVQSLGMAQRLVLRGHEGEVLCAAFSADGRRIVTGSSDGTVRVWDADSGAELGCLRGHETHVWAVGFAPDSGRVASSSEDGTVRIWDTSAGRALFRFDSDRSRKRWVGFSPDGQRLVAITGGTITTWDTTTGRELQTAYMSGALSMCLSRDGEWIVTASSDGTMQTYDAATRTELQRFPSQRKVRCGTLSFDSRRLASGSDDGTVLMWDATSGIQIHCMSGHRDLVQGVAISSDGLRIASAGYDGSVRIWDAASGAEVRRFHHESGVFTVAFAPDDRHVVSASFDHTARVWDLTSEVLEARPLRGHESWIWNVAFSGNGRRVATASDDGTVIVWDAETGVELACLRGHAPTAFDRIHSVALSVDGRLAVSGSEDSSVRVWSVGNAIAKRRLFGHEEAVRSVTTSPDGNLIASGSDDGTLRIWAISTMGKLRWDLSARLRLLMRSILGLGELGRMHRRKRVTSPRAVAPGGWLARAGEQGTVEVLEAGSTDGWRVLHGHTAPVQCLAFSEDGKRLASASRDGTIRIWDPTSRLELSCLSGHDGSVWNLAFVRAPWLVTELDDGRILLWDLRSGVSVRVRVLPPIRWLKELLRGHRELRCLYGHEGEVSSVAFSPSGERVVSGSNDRTVRIWDLMSGAELHCFSESDDEVKSVAFSPDGRFVAGGTISGGVRLWEVQSNRELCRLQGPRAPVRRVWFSPHGLSISSEFGDGTVRCWNVAEGEPGERPDLDPGNVLGAVCGVTPGVDEMMIESPCSGQPVAWWPAALPEVTTSPSGRTWAGSVRSYVCLFRLEGTM